MKWNKKEKVRAPKAIIDNNLVFKIRDDNSDALRATKVGSSS